MLGLRILNMLVAEFNQPTPGRTMTQHRKLAVAFRDHSLFAVLSLALAALRQLQPSASADAKLREQARPARMPDPNPVITLAGRQHGCQAARAGAPHARAPDPPLPGARPGACSALCGARACF